jgi:hypothetical protein
MVRVPMKVSERWECDLLWLADNLAKHHRHAIT